MISTTVVHLTAMRTPDLRDAEIARVADMTERELRELVDGLSAVAVSIMAASDTFFGRDFSGQFLREVALDQATDGQYVRPLPDSGPAAVLGSLARRPVRWLRLLWAGRK